jgi:hypothetical protein
MCIAIHKYMEATLGISLYSSLYLKLAKTMSFLLSPMLYLQQNQRTRGQKRFCLEVGGEVAQTFYTHVSKCKKEMTVSERFCTLVENKHFVGLI